MVAENVLMEHLAACELTYQTMLEENRILKATAAPPEDGFLSRKRTVLAQLEGALAMLRSLGDSPTALTAQQRATIMKTQQIVLKALLLDRENEQLLLKYTAPARRAAAPQVRPTLDQIQRLYRKHGSSQEAAV